MSTTRTTIEAAPASMHRSRAVTGMHDPSHPGDVLRHVYLEDISVTDAARKIGVSRKTLSAILNCRQRVTAEMAYRLAAALDTSPELWVNLQANRDLWEARDTDTRQVEKIVAA